MLILSKIQDKTLKNSIKQVSIYRKSTMMHSVTTRFIFTPMGEDESGKAIIYGHTYVCMYVCMYVQGSLGLMPRRPED